MPPVRRPRFPTPTTLKRAWQHTAWRLALVVLCTLLLGLLIGQPWPLLCAGLLGVLVWHYAQLHRLLGRLNRRERLEAPEGAGVLSELARVLYLRQRENRERKRRLLGTLRAFRQAAAALPDAVVVLNRREQRIEWFNESTEHLLGLSYPKDIGNRFSNLVRSPRVTAWLESGAAEPLIDVQGTGVEGLRLSMRLLDYTPEEQLLIARDISKLLHLEQVRRDFVANVSHELRTPLTVLHGYLDMLEPEDVPEWAGMLGEMRRQSGRMTQIVEDLLTLSRLESRDSLPQEPVEMASMLASLRGEAEAMSAGRHRIEIEDLAGCDLLGSAKELHSAFSNLVINAVRYTPEGGRVRVEFHPTAEGGASLCVIDSGPGIAPQHLPRLTERFYRVSTSRSRDSGGTGLGLAIVKHILQLHQAQLLIDSEVGVGSRFCCVFDAGHRVAREEVDVGVA
jgi:two-component system phosphate regulon sensor histidine kinase PhoR